MKRKNICFTRVTACLLGGAVVAVSGQAAAAACPTGANTVYFSGSSAFIPVVQAVANLLGAAVNIVYQKPGSCEGLAYVLGDMGTAVLPDADAALSLAPNGASGGVACTLPTIAVGATTEPAAKIDIAVSDVYDATCQGSFDPNLNSVGSSTMTKDYLGPIQAMTFAVPTASTEQVISAEAAYMVFGFDAMTTAESIMPWTVPTDIFVRFWDSGTLEMIATAINLPGGKWANATSKTSTQYTASTQAMTTALLTAAMKSTPDTNATIGILGAANYVTGLRPLAFQAVGQSCGYLPDSSSTAHDKLNVRQGRYAIWGPEHLVVNVDANGNPLGQNANTASVQAVLNALVATSQAPAASSADGGLTDAEEGMLISAISVPATGVIPQCAMQVTRSSEIGPEASYAPPAACSCAFEEAAGSVVAGHTCTACTGTGAGVCTGATPACHFGYCEAE
jgi:ABC-type phosphate transport system substrate-binding protein